MKCGGVSPALDIARVADGAGVTLMWGCMDESCIGISAALHAALASPATRYLDLDGSFDLAHDLGSGGFDGTGRAQTCMYRLDVTRVWGCHPIWPISTGGCRSVLSSSMSVTRRRRFGRRWVTTALQSC